MQPETTNEIKPSVQAEEQGAIELRPHKDGVLGIYTNFLDICWGLHDIQLRFSRLIPVNSGYSGEALRFVAEQQAAVTMAWSQAKLLRDVLVDAIERYEVANGELKWPKLPTQNMKENREQQLLTRMPDGKAN